VDTGESISVDFLSESGGGPSSLAIDYGSGSSFVPVHRRKLAAPARDLSPFAGGYRGWSAGMWNENIAFAPTGLLDEYKTLTSQTEERQLEIRRTAVAPQPVFASTFAGGPAWTAPLSAAFVAQTGLHAARLGMVVSPDDADRGGLFSGTFARQSATRGFYLGASASLDEMHIANLSVQATQSTTNTTTDVVDLNGDGILDVIAGRQTTLSLLAGATAPVLGSVLDLRDGFRKRSAKDYSIGFGANAVRKVTTPGGRPVEASPTVAPDGPFGGTGYAISRGQTSEDLVDINGDGLPDRVRRSGPSIYAQLNLGNRFGVEELFGVVAQGMQLPIDGFEQTVEATPVLFGLVPWLSLNSTSDALQHETTITRNRHDGININIPLVGSVSAGRSTVATTTRTTLQLADLYGDGLADILL
jgi:hypothetical protein